MSSPITLVDTGVLVALLNGKERYHLWAIEMTKKLPAPFLTCEPVLTETFFLAATIAHGPRRFFEILKSGLLAVNFSVLDENEALQALVHKYRDLPMSLADACLVRLAEVHSDASVLTLDHHFQIYRKSSRQSIPVIMP